MTGESESPSVLSAFLKLTSPSARILLVLFLLTQWVLALTTLRDVHAPWISVAALLLVSAAAIVVVLPGASPLPMPSAILVLAAVMASTALVSWNLSNPGWPGYASWPLGANTFVLLALGLRGRVRLSWVGMLAMTVITIAWTMSTGEGLPEGIDLIDRNAGVLLIGTLFAIAFRRAATTVASYHAAELRRAEAESEIAAREQQRQEQARRLDRDIRPLLELIAHDEELSASQREQLRVAEATLRDEIRAGDLLREPLTTSVRRARERGIDLLLLDDSAGTLTTNPLFPEALAWAMGAVESAETGRLVIRLRPEGHERFASIHIEDGTHPRTIEYPR